MDHAGTYTPRSPHDFTTRRRLGLTGHMTHYESTRSGLKSTFSVPKAQVTCSAVPEGGIEKQSYSGKLWESSGGGRQDH